MNVLRSFGVVVCLSLLVAPIIRAQEAWTAKMQQADALEKAGRPREAIALYLQLVEPLEKEVGANSPVAAQLYNALGIALARQGESEASAEWFQKALKTYEALYGPDSARVAGMLNNLAIQKRRAGRYDDSEKLFLRSLALAEPQFGPDHPAIADTFKNLGTLYRDMGRYADSDRAYRRSLKIWEARRDELQIAELAGSMGNLLRLQSRYQDAEVMLRRALQTIEARKGRDHADLAIVLGNLAGVYQVQERWAETEPLLLRALAIFEAKYGPEHPNVGIMLNNLASLRLDEKKFAEAEAIYARALKIKHDKDGVDHPAYAAAIENLGICYWRQGKIDAAEKQFREALRIFERAFGPDHPETAKLYVRLAVVEAYRGEDVSAVLRRYDQARKGMHRHIALVLPSLSDRQQLDFLRTSDQPTLHEALWFSATAGGQPAADAGAEWLLNGKGVGHIASAQRALLLRAGRERNAGAAVDELLEVRRKLADLSMTAPEPAQVETRKATLARLTAQDVELSKQLAIAVGTADESSKWIASAEVRRALPADGVLIDFAKTEVIDFKSTQYSKKKPFRYAAWITPPAGKGEIRVVDLGPAEEIDALVATVRGHLESAGSPTGLLATEGESAAVAALAPEMNKLAAKIWKPLAPHLASAKQLLLSPDGMLWLVPWAALPVDDANKVLLESFALRLLVSGRDVLPHETPKLPMQSGVIFADPLFDAAAASKQAVLKSQFPNAAPAAIATRGFGAQSVLPKVAALPGTATEASLVQPQLEKYLGGKTTLYSRDYALESVAKKMIVRPLVFVFATHGFFLPDQESRPGDAALGVDANGAEFENPFLRCGLLLTGCNDRTANIADDDGILTGLEICSLDLRGTRLVVLSACETGVGKVHNGEGVAGLRQAFQLAGAEAVIASLWQVPDKDSALIMTEFFTQLAEGKSKAEALRAAQLARIAARKERFGAAHPFYWAAWTLTGN